MKTLARRLALAAAVALGLPGAAVAAPAAPLDPVALIEGWLLPRYDTLVVTTAAQRDAWTTFCAAPSAAGVSVLKEAFGKAADSWTAVEFVTMGPASQSLRPDRFNFFPDRRNAVSRGMAEILGSADPARLGPERFAQASAAVQGLPALERLLHEEGGTEGLVSGPEAAFRCAYGSAIALNLATMAAEIRTAWGDRSSGLLATIVAGKADPAYFPDMGALPGMILTDLSGAYQRATDTRILPVLGSGPAEAKPALAEGWRSGRSGRVVTVMVESAGALLQKVALQLPSRPQWVVNKAAAAADAAAAAFPPDLAAAAQTADGTARVQAAVKVFKAAQLTVYRPVAAYFGISLGFNALDGD